MVAEKASDLILGLPPLAPISMAHQAPLFDQRTA
jgi:hypothetical protein